MPRLTEEQVASLRQKIVELLETQQFALFWPDEKGKMHTMVCANHPNRTLRAIRSACKKLESGDQ